MLKIYKIVINNNFRTTFLLRKKLIKESVIKIELCSQVLTFSTIFNTSFLNER